MDALQGNFVPWLHAIGATLRQTSLQALAGDPAAMASAVVDTAKLFNTPVVCANFDHSLWAEAAGCSTDWGGALPVTAPGGSADPNPDAVRGSERLTTLIQALERIKGAMPQAPLACAVTGPATLCQLLQLDASSRLDQFTVGELMTEFVTILCENPVDHVIIAEGADLDDAALAPWMAGKHYSRIAKLAQHYDKATTGLCPSASLSDDQLAELNQLTYVIGEPSATIGAELANATKGIAVTGFGTGAVALPESLDQLADGSYFLTTAGDADPTSEIEAIQADLAAIAAR